MYVLSSNVEDVEMKDAEDDEDEEDAVAEELGMLFHVIQNLSGRQLTPCRQE